MVLYGMVCVGGAGLSLTLSLSPSLTLTHSLSHSHSLSPSLSAGMVCLGGAGGAAEECLENSEPNEAQVTIQSIPQ